MKLQDELWKNNKKEIIRIMEEAGLFDSELLREILTEDELMEYYAKIICNTTEEMDSRIDIC